MPDDARDPAPALGRGLAILDHLALCGASSLERLCATLALPKSSGLRILESLQLAGAVQRDPTSKRYRALLRLGPVEAADSVMQHHAATIAEAAADESGFVSEVYALRDGIPFMVDRYVPEEFEDSMQARIGYQRDMRELEGIAQVAIAWGTAELKEEHWQWGGDTRRETLPRDRCRRMVRRARQRGCGVDTHPNEAGIRRYAAPLLDHRDVLRGIFVLAEAHADSRVHEELITKCKRCANVVTYRLGGEAAEIHR